MLLCCFKQEKRFHKRKWKPSSVVLPSLVFVPLLLLVYDKSLQVSHTLSTSAKCNIGDGEWVWDPAEPPYTNSCSFISKKYNCLKERPDRDYLHWRWKPHECELQRFDARWFLDLMRDKSMAFVGDLLARNHMQSLICHLSKLEPPKDHSMYNFEDGQQTVLYTAYNFTIRFFHNPFLIKYESEAAVARKDAMVKIYLNEVDHLLWKEEISKVDYLIISPSPWFLGRSLQVYEHEHLIGQQHAHTSANFERKHLYYYMIALRSVFRELNGMKDFKGKVILRSFSLQHYDDEGKCEMTRPLVLNETMLSFTERMLHKVEVEEFEEAVRQARLRGLEFKLLDVTKGTWARADGHPGRFGKDDCESWCLPGPVDAWNYMLMHLLRTG